MSRIKPSNQPQDPLLKQMFESAGTVPLSFELFPPRTEEGRQAQSETVDRLAPVADEGFSVTMGAGGGTRDGSLHAATEVMRRSQRKVMAHLPALGLTREQTVEAADKFWNAGITRILALRGDRPRGSDGPLTPGFEHATDLVAALAARQPFEIAVAAHPEKHPEAASLDADIEHLKEKLDAGASRAYCQFVLDPAKYGRFVEACGKHGIDAPIVPGLMPLDDWPQMRRFAVANGVAVPGWLDRFLAETEESPEVSSHLAAVISVEYARRLIAYGAPEIHVYTMNRWQLPLVIARSLGHVDG